MALGGLGWQRAEVPAAARTDLPRALLCQTAIGVLVVDCDEGRLLVTNERACLLLRRSAEELRKTTLLALVATEDLATVGDRLAEVAAGRSSLAVFEMRCLDPQGTQRTLHATVSALVNDETVAESLLVVLEEGPDLVSPRERLHEFETQLTAIADAEPDLVDLIGADGTLLYVNPGGLRILEADSQAELLGRKATDFVAPHDLTTVETAIRAVLAGEPERITCELVGLRGGRRTVECHGFPIWTRGEPRRVRAILTVTRDLTASRRIQRDLARSRTILETTLAACELGTFEVDPTTRTATWSPEMFRLYGRDPSLGVPFPEAFHHMIDPADRTVLQDAFEEALRQDRRIAIDFRTAPTFGPVRHFNVTMQRSSGEDGTHTVIGIVQDITARKEIDQALCESRDRLDGILRSLDDVVWSADAETLRLLFVNPAAERVLGRSVAELLRSPGAWLDAIHPDDGTRVREAREALRHHGESEVTYRIAHPDGTVRWIRERARLAWGADGQGGRVDGILSDVTTRRRYVDALRASEERFRRLLERSWDVCVLTDVAGRTLFITDSVERLFGYPPDYYLGAVALRDVHPDNAAHVIDTFEKLLTNPGEPMRFDCRARHRDGSWRSVEVISTNLLYDPCVGAIVSNVRDVTDRRAAEEQVRRLNAELEARVRQRTMDLVAANQDLESFSYTVSHDLRAPLRAIDGFSQILAEDHGAELTDGGRHCLSRIRLSTRRMALLIDDLLRLARIGRATLEQQRVDVGALVVRVWEDLLAERIDRHVELVVAPLPTCSGDPVMLQQLIQNLVSNALKFTRGRDAARVEVGYTTAFSERHPDTPGAYFVRDNGVGFDPRYGDQLFGLFQRLHGEGYEGTGVGLAIVERVVARHRGRVWAEGSPGLGATFYFTVGVEPHRRS
jgi:PAS domain S-box-containing protein